MRQILLTIFTFLFFTVAYSQGSFEEEFDLDNRVLNSQNGWSGNTSFEVVSDNMSLPNYFFTNSEEKAISIQSSGGTISRDNPATNPLSAGAAYLSFLVRIDDKNNLRAVEDYQVGIRKSIFTTSFVGVGFYRDDANESVIKAALQTNSSSDWVNSTQTFSENTVYHVVLKYQFNSGANDDLFVFISDSFMSTEPMVATLETVVTGTGLPDNIGSVILNAHPNSSNVLLVDGLQMGNAWNGFNTVALPIELKDFSGIQKNNQVQLNWVTASEYDNDYFTIEKSKDGVEFITIGEVSSKGDSRTDVAYQFIDERPYSGLNYYRLKQTDFDRTSTTSNIIVVSMEQQKEPVVTIFPNPATDYFSLELAIDNFDKKCNLNITNISGQVKLSQILEGQNNIQIQTNDWTSGWYVIQLSFQDGRSIVEKIFVQ